MCVCVCVCIYHLNSDCFISSFLICIPFTSSSCLVPMTRTTSTMWNKSGEVGIFVLFLILEEMPWNISPFTFKVIIGGYVLAAFLVNYFLVVFVCCCSFLLLLSFLLIWWLFLVLHFESFLFFMCLSIIDFWFVVSNHVYQSMYIHS